MSKQVTSNQSFPVMIRLSPEIKKVAMELAKEDDRSFNSWVSLLIKKAVGQSNKEIKENTGSAIAVDPVVPSHFAGWDA